MSEAQFRLIYDGEAVRDGEMDVADLAPALMGVGQLLKASGRVMFGDDSDVRVRVRVRTMKDGSFDVHLSAAVKVAGSVWAFLKGPDVQAAEALIGALGFTGLSVGHGVIAVVRRMKGRRPVIKASRPGFVSMEIDGVTMEVPEAEARMAMDAGVRAALARVIAEPLERDGIDSVGFGGEGPDALITKDEASSFREPIDSGDDEFVSRYQKVFSIQALSFKPDRKWRLSDGHGSAKLVTISDPEFEARVQRNEVRFAKGDVLICDVIERSRRSATGFRSEYEIARVLEHRPAVAHPSLDLSTRRSDTAA